MSNLFTTSCQKLVQLFGLILLLSGCGSAPDPAILQGTIKYAGNSKIYIEKQPIHYKYASQKRFKIKVDEDNRFRQTIHLDSAQIIDLVINETSYPLYATPDDTLSIRAERGTFPYEVQVKGYAGPWDHRLNRYLKSSDTLLKHASKWDQAFDTGKNDSLLYFYKQRIKTAREWLRGTPFEPLIYKAIGEYLVHRLRYLKNRIYHQGIHPAKLDSKRHHILELAQQYNFFSFRSLWAQRAGIFDFANAYALSSGIEKKLEAKREQDLMLYDVKRLGYPVIDSLKVSLLSYIKERKARAYAQMYLVAERIGEMPIDTARASYQAFLRKYSDFPQFTAFLKQFYQKRERVSPGHKAVPFTLPTPHGNTISMSDFRGKYVLLDFWASWCIPCLNEFPHMKNLYQQYPRSKFEIIGISIEKDSLRWRSALEKFDLPWPQVYGGNGFQQKTFSTYQAGGIPFYILVGPKGTIRRYNDIRPSFNLPRVLDSLIRTPASQRTHRIQTSDAKPVFRQ